MENYSESVLHLCIIFPAVLLGSVQAPFYLHTYIPTYLDIHLVFSRSKTFIEHINLGCRIIFCNRVVKEHSPESEGILGKLLVVSKFLSINEDNVEI